MPWLMLAQEDELLRRLVEQQNPTKGNKIQFGPIADQFPGRDTKQCRDRYNDYLDPALDTSPLTDNEMQLLLVGKYYKTKMPEILESFPTKRSSNMMRNLWSRPSLKKIIQDVSLVGKRHQCSLGYGEFFRVKPSLLLLI
jgi:hypothetical protein